MDSRWTASLGLALVHHDTAVHAAAWARAAERAGLGSVWIIEDYFHPGAFALAGAAGAVTERIAIGLGVVNPYTRHPALLAMETAALAGIAPGRVVLGLGSSNRRWIEEQMAIPFKMPLNAVRECVEIVRRLLAGERLTFRGESFALEGVALEATPAQAVPIFLGVKGPKALAMAAEIADGVHCAVLASSAHVRRVRQTSGGRGAVISYVVMAVDADSGRARQAVRPVLARYLGLLHGQSILEDAGLGPARTQPFKDALLRGASAASLVTDEMVEALAVAGTPDECRRGLRRFAEAGLDTAVAVIPGELDMTEQIARVGELSAAWKEMRWP
jgi:alkanesulfonate monooxygenase SsuD/methylene tetrahydromethanopterin reductase-like flavin-dependent oxidoreductase (luciferase family)